MSKKIYQFKISLKGIRPSIWRRIQIPENYDFYELHVAIQDAMGWYDYHLHQYEYDFGDSWEHKVVLEKIIPAEEGEKYPKCIAGKRACPPEDCGGIWGYEELLNIMSNPKHPKYKERKEWLGGKLEPEKFDPKAVVFEDPKERLKLRLE